MNELALFAGAGGGLLGTRLLGWTPVCAVEKEPYRREVLLRRQRDGVLPLFPIWSDVRSFTTSNNACRRTIKAIRRCRPLVITAGFPCQPFSVAGKQLGEADERNMWPETIRIIREVRPDFCLLENVPQLVRHDYFGVILGDLAEAGFDAEWDIVSAADVGAPHIRKRVWIVASERQCLPNPECPGALWTNEGKITLVVNQMGSGMEQSGGAIPDSDSFDGRSGTGRQDGPEACDRCPECGGELEYDHNSKCCHRCQRMWPIDFWWDREPAEGPVESAVGRVAHGVANRVDRLAAIGDGQVPAVVRAAWLLLSGELNDPS